MLLTIAPTDSVEKARSYLRDLKVDTAEGRGEKRKHEPAIQVAFTIAGIKKLGVPETSWKTFSRCSARWE